MDEVQVIKGVAHALSLLKPTETLNLLTCRDDTAMRKSSTSWPYCMTPMSSRSYTNVDHRLRARELSDDQRWYGIRR